MPALILVKRLNKITIKTATVSFLQAAIMNTFGTILAQFAQQMFMPAGAERIKALGECLVLAEMHLH